MSDVLLIVLIGVVYVAGDAIHDELEAIRRLLEALPQPPEQEVSDGCERKDCNWVCGDNERVTGAEVCLTCKSFRAAETGQVVSGVDLADEPDVCVTRPMREVSGE